MKENLLKSHLLKDTLILIFFVTLTLVVAQLGFLDSLLEKLSHAGFVGAFVSGIFFTSVFTVAGATIALIEISNTSGVVGVAFFGALGAVVGDLVLFLFVRDRIKKDVDEMIVGAKARPFELIRIEFLRWLNPLLGIVLIITPFPDELGLALLGFSKIKTETLVFGALAMHLIGIYLMLSFFQTL